MTPRGLWLRIGGGIMTAAALFVVDVPPPTGSSVSAPVAVCVGLVAGLALFSTLAGLVPRLANSTHARRWLIRSTFLALWAAVEEIVWRMSVLGALALHGGWPLALAASSAAFALAHQVGKTSHLVTGLTFGAVYVATGHLLAAIVAHIIYNLLLAEAIGRTRPLEIGAT